MEFNKRNNTFKNLTKTVVVLEGIKFVFLALAILVIADIVTLVALALTNQSKVWKIFLLSFGGFILSIAAFMEVIYRKNTSNWWKINFTKKGTNIFFISLSIATFIVFIVSHEMEYKLISRFGTSLTDINAVRYTFLSVFLASSFCSLCVTSVEVHNNVAHK